MQRNIDIVIASNRSIDILSQVLLEATEDVERWQRHHFIIVFDEHENLKQLKLWLEENDHLPLPQITPCIARPGAERNVASLRQQGLEQGTNPYIYFQDDDDPLPRGLEKRMSMMEDGEWQAIYGVTRTINGRGQTVEEFPPLLNNNFICNPKIATKYFPTYVHPLAALFRRSLFDTMSLDDGKRYTTGCNNFSTQLFHSGTPIFFSVDVIRTVRHHSENDTGILSSKAAEGLAHDILKWTEYINDKDIEEFQRKIAHALMDKSILTFREIAARVEEQVEL